MMGGSNGGHHTKWMVESYPDLDDDGIAGYGFNSQVSQWGGIATVLRHYDVIAPRIDDIIAKRAADPSWDPTRSPKAVQKELRWLDLTGNLKRPVIVMHGTADAIVSRGESDGYRALVKPRETSPTRPASAVARTTCMKVISSTADDTGTICSNWR